MANQVESDGLAETKAMGNRRARALWQWLQKRTPGADHLSTAEVLRLEKNPLQRKGQAGYETCT